MTNVLVTGGAGFIGSNFVRYMLGRHRGLTVVNYDLLTYAGNPENLEDLAGDPRYRFVQGDICDREAVDRCLEEHGCAAGPTAPAHGLCLMEVYY